MTRRLGIVGLGTIGQRMLGNVARHDGYTLAAGWDPDPEAVAQAQARAPEMAAPDDAAALIARDDVDAVYIGCPPAWHREYVELALAHGKPLLCEKPLSVTDADAAAMVAAVEGAGIPAAVNFVHASCAAVDAMEQALKSGALGEIAGAHLHCRFARWPRDWQARAEWLRFREQGGFVREVVSHFVYLSLRLFGDARLTGALTTFPDDPALCETGSLARLDCNGVTVTMASVSGGTGPDEVSYLLAGSEKSLRLESWYVLKESAGDRWAVPEGMPDDVFAEAGQHVLDNLAALIEGRPHSMARFAEAAQVQRIVEAMLRKG